MGAARAALVVVAAVPITLAGTQTAVAQATGVPAAGTHAADAGWVRLTLPAPNGLAVGLGDVSCTSTAFCAVVGGAQGRHRGSRAFAETWNGTSWTIENIQNAPRAVLSSVSCTAPDNCTAVGYQFSPQTVSPVPLAEHWDGMSWTVQSTPITGSAGELTGVSCTSPARCVAVGAENFDSVLLPFSESWNGAAWRPRTAPAPPDTTSSFSGVSCRSGRSCVAVGTTETSAPLAESWNGARWTAQTVPAPGGVTFADLNGVSCRRTTACMAVGDTSTSGHLQTLAEQWNGAAWAVVSTPHLAGVNSQGALESVSCPRRASCTATGDLVLRRKDRVLAEHWNGTGWTQDATVKPVNSQDSSLGGVSCLPGSNCIAVGGYISARGRGRMLAEQHS